MNYSYLPRKVIRSYNIYDKTCPSCYSKNTFGTYNMLSCDHFYCNNCKKYFTSTTVIKTVQYETEEEVLP